MGIERLFRRLGFEAVASEGFERTQRLPTLGGIASLESWPRWSYQAKERQRAHWIGSRMRALKCADDEASGSHQDVSATRIG